MTQRKTSRARARSRSTNRVRPGPGPESRPRHQRILVPKDDSSRADLRLTIIVFSVVALLAMIDFATVRSGNGLVLAVVVLGYSFFRAFQGWTRYLSAGRAAANVAS